jgi:hypothetical protein
MPQPPTRPKTWADTENLIASRQLDILVPIGDTTIAPGSGIVRAPNDNARFGASMVYYEGNIYNAANIRDFDERLRHAAGRLVENYPTVAKEAYSPGRFRKVGTYDAAVWRIVDLDQSSALKDWRPEDLKIHFRDPSSPDAVWNSLMRFLRVAPVEFGISDNAANHLIRSRSPQALRSIDGALSHLATIYRGLSIQSGADAIAECQQLLTRTMFNITPQEGSDAEPGGVGFPKPA